VRSRTIAGLSVPFRHYLDGTPRRSPGVSSCAFGAQPLDLRLWSLMDMDFVLSCALVRPQRLVSSFCSSARTCDTRFFQTSPHGDALAFLSPSPPSGWQRDLHPPSTGTCPAHMKPPRSKLRGITRKGVVCETPQFLTLFPLQGNLGASSEESPDSKRWNVARGDRLSNPNCSIRATILA
jgi:hypothetical protein